MSGVAFGCLDEWGAAISSRCTEMTSSESDPTTFFNNGIGNLVQISNGALHIGVQCVSDMTSPEDVARLAWSLDYNPPRDERDQCNETDSR